MKEKILSLIFTENDNEDIDGETENNIFKSKEEDSFAGYLEQKVSILDTLLRKDKLVSCKKIKISEIEESKASAVENKVEFARLAASIKENGMLLPITVYRTENKRYKIIDGEKRLKALKLLKREEIYCTILPCSEKVGEVLRIGADCSDMLEYGRKIGDLLLDSDLDRELLSRTSLLSQKKIGALIDIALLSESEAAMLRNISLKNLLCEIAAIHDPRFRDYVIITLAEYFKDFEQDVKRVIANKDKRYTPSDKMIIKDIRIVFNSIESSLNKLRKSGIRVNAEKCESDNEYTYVIKVKKP